MIAKEIPPPLRAAPLLQAQRRLFFKRGVILPPLRVGPASASSAQALFQREAIPAAARRPLFSKGGRYLRVWVPLAFSKGSERVTRGLGRRKFGTSLGKRACSPFEPGTGSELVEGGAGGI